MGALLDDLGKYVVPQVGQVSNEDAMAAAPLPPGTPPPQPGAPPSLYDPNNWLMAPSGQTAPYPSAGMDPAAPGAGQPANPYGDAPPAPTAPNPGQATTGVPANPDMAPPSRATAPAGPRDVTDVAGFMGQQGQALNQAEESASGAAVLKNEAARQLANREGQAYTKSADDLTGINEEYSKALDAAHRQAAAENVQWMTQMDQLAKQEPNPHRWFEKSSTLGQGLFLLSMLAGARAESLSPRVKVGIFDQIDKMMEDDVKVQEQRISRQYESGKLRGAQLNQEHQQILTDLQDRFSKKLLKVEALKQAYLAQAKAPTSADDKAAVAASVAELDKLRVNVVGERFKESVTMREGQLNRSKDMALAQYNQGQENRRALLTQEGEDRRAALSASLKQTPEEKKLEDQQGLPDNVKLIGDGGKLAGDGTVLVHKDKKPEAADLNYAANVKYAALVRTRDALRNAGTLEVALKRNPQLASDIVTLGYTAIKQLAPGDKITDADFANGIKSTFGADVSSVKGALYQMAANGGFDKVADLVDKEINDLPQTMSKKLEGYVDYSLPSNKRAHVLWQPAPMEVPRPREPGAAESLAAAGVPASDVPKTPEPVTQQQFENQRALGDLPAYKRSGTAEQVNQAKDSFDGMDPASINKAKEARMKAVEGDSRALHEIDEAGRQAVEHANSNARALKDYLEHQAQIEQPRTQAARQMGREPSGWTKTGADIREHVKEVAEKEYGFLHADPAFLERVAQDVEKYLRKD